MAHLASAISGFLEFKGCLRNSNPSTIAVPTADGNVCWLGCMGIDVRPSGAAAASQYAYQPVVLLHVGSKRCMGMQAHCRCQQVLISILSIGAVCSAWRTGAGC
jgi:hypothetical protein